jgi:Zn ribbon nucleic-acid-binding protein
MRIVSNCPLCEEKSLHVVEEDNMDTQQCINCGYATSTNFDGTKEDNEMYKTLPEEMQSWSKEANGRIWIPSLITLPFGTLYPTNVGDEMKWGFAEMVDIPEEEQKDYPVENGEGFYKQKYDTDNAKIYDIFLEAMAEMNERAKADGPSKIST